MSRFIRARQITEQQNNKDELKQHTKLLHKI